MRLRWGLALLAFGVAFGAGVALVGALAPDGLRRETESQLAEALGGPVEIRGFRIAPGFGLRLVAETVSAWPGEAGPRLQVERIEARLRPLSFLAGGPLFGRLRFDGLRLALERDRAGGWEPPPLARLAERGPVPAPAREPWLEPAAALESLARALLDGPGFADGIELRGARVVFRDAKPPGGGPVELELAGLEARLRRHRILGGADLFLRATLLASGVERGTLEVLGSRSRDGAVEIAVATTALDLATFAAYLQREEQRVPIAGTLSGYLGSKSAAPGENTLELDLVIAGLRTLIPDLAGGEPRPVEVPRMDLAGFLDISRDALKLREFRFENARLRLEIAGRIARPLGARSAASLSLAMRDLEVEELRDLLAWLPEIRREQAMRGLERIEAGRVAQLTVGGAAPLADWQLFLSGRTRTLPEKFSLEAEVAEARLRVGDSDRLENLSGKLAWTGDHLEVEGARAELEGNPLPVLDLSLDGVSNFLAVDPERRRLAPGGEPLPGLDALAEVLTGDPEAEHPPVETRIRIELDTVDHPSLLWPIEQLAAAIELAPGGARVDELRGIWAGVPISGDAVYAHDPEPTARVRLVAEAAAGAPPVARGPGWAHGRFEVERLATRFWSHEHGRGRLTARGTRFDFEDVEASLAPSGRVFGTASLDLGRADGVPYRASFQLEQGDVSGVAGMLQLPANFATGQVDLAGSFAGILAREVPGWSGLTGLLSVRARDGEIRRVLPAVVAIALASRSFNPFTGREQIRYDSAETILEFSDGGIHTESLAIDGPDMRVFASGDVSLSSPTKELDGHVVLFLFRQLDNVIGKIPVLNLLLLGTNENLLTAYFDLTGPWADPDANLVPLRSLPTGPASLVLDGVPFLVRKGLQAIGAIDGDAGGAPARPFSPEPPPRKDS